MAFDVRFPGMISATPNRNKKRSTLGAAFQFGTYGSVLGFLYGCFRMPEAWCPSRSLIS